jgi:hypothetical protein
MIRNTQLWFGRSLRHKSLGNRVPSSLHNRSCREPFVKARLHLNLLLTTGSVAEHDGKLRFVGPHLQGGISHSLPTLRNTSRLSKTSQEAMQ